MTSRIQSMIKSFESDIREMCDEETAEKVAQSLRLSANLAMQAAFTHGMDEEKLFRAWYMLYNLLGSLVGNGLLNELDEREISSILKGK